MAQTPHNRLLWLLIGRHNDKGSGGGLGSNLKVGVGFGAFFFLSFRCQEGMPLLTALCCLFVLLTFTSLLIPSLLYDLLLLFFEENDDFF